jgi:hypothetical protein
MRLHGNAALSWQGRRQLARRVVVEGWTLTRAAEAAGVRVRCARRWASRIGSRVSTGCLTVLLRPGGSGIAPPMTAWR